MRRIARIDANQQPIVVTLRAIGCSVQSLASVGDGCPDLLVGLNGRNFLLEIKNDALSPCEQQLTPAEMAWHAAWKGRVRVVHNVNEALLAVGAEPQ